MKAISSNIYIWFPIFRNMQVLGHCFCGPRHVYSVYKIAAHHYVQILSEREGLIKLVDESSGELVWNRYVGTKDKV